MIRSFINSCRFMMEHVVLAYPNFFEDHTLIFEGAQGLLLDMDYGYFPHVTRSNCGMKNISKILKTIPGEHDIMVNYVTRAYTTRHGAGPLADEWTDMPEYYNIVDETNIPNQFQGELRFGILDYRLLQSVTDKDFLNYAPRSAKRTYTMTCIDQLNPDGLEAIEDFAMKHIHFNYKSYGPTRKDVKNDTSETINTIPNE
jgi:adenylosuccinate synthase